MKWFNGKLLLIVVALSLTLGFIVFSSYKTADSTEFSQKYSVFSLTIPDKLEFAGEKVPLDYFDVKESLDRELHVNTYWQSQTIFFIKRANRFFPEIERILKEENVPTDFKYLAVAESGLTNTVSPAAASGFWQFLKSTGKEYGLEINEQVDERYNIEEATKAACKFLKESYNKYGSWTLAAASYNMGRQSLSKSLAVQKEDNYYNLFLNEETARYVFRILALKVILEDPELYGFHVGKNDLYPPLKYSSVKVDSSIPDLAEFAKKHNTNYKILRLYNPWIKENSLINAKKAIYYIRIPEDGFREAMYMKADSATILADTSSVKITN
jgi:hypothetical protein